MQVHTCVRPHMRPHPVCRHSLRATTEAPDAASALRAQVSVAKYHSALRRPRLPGEEADSGAGRERCPVPGTSVGPESKEMLGKW